MVSETIFSPLSHLFHHDLYTNALRGVNVNHCVDWQAEVVLFMACRVAQLLGVNLWAVLRLIMSC